MGVLIEWEENGNTSAIELDVVWSQGFEITAEVSEHPVEQGADVADHVNAAGDTLTMEGWVTNQPITLPRTQMSGVTAETIARDTKAGKLLTQGWTGAFDRKRTVDRLLVELIRRGQLLTVTTGLRQVDNLVLTRHRADRTAEVGDAVGVTLEFKRLRIASTQTVTVPDPVQRRGLAGQHRGAQAAQPPNARRTSALLRGLNALGVQP